MNSPPTIGIVAGSGIDLDALLDTKHKTTLFSDVANLCPTTVLGHQGRFIQGTSDETPIILQTGRLHLYEGYTYSEITRSVDTLHAMGASMIIFTNAAGGLRPEMQAGHLMAADSIELWPCNQWPEHPESITPTQVLKGCDSRGTYTWIHGPCYETQAEIHALQAIQSDAIGMSTAPEVARCNELGIESASITCITNNCCSPHTLTHEHVIKIAHQASQRIQAIIRAALPELTQVGPRQ